MKGMEGMKFWMPGFIGRVGSIACKTVVGTDIPPAYWEKYQRAWAVGYILPSGKGIIEYDHWPDLYDLESARNGSNGNGQPNNGAVTRTYTYPIPIQFFSAVDGEEVAP